MGIPKFFRWVSERYPLCTELIDEDEIPQYDNLYLDMNGIIHNASKQINQKGCKSFEEIVQAIFSYLVRLFNIIKPQKLLYLAVDGVAPRAKMNQQRARRFRAVKETLKKSFSHICGMNSTSTNSHNHESLDLFDSNCITAGTEFMHALNSRLKELIKNRIKTDFRWSKIEIIYSGSDVPGEGEHKVMEYIRSLSNPGNIRHCLYGLDADLIILGLLSHSPYFSLLREEVTFGKMGGGPSSSFNSTRGNNKSHHHQHRNQNHHSSLANSNRFNLVHLGLLRDYLECEFSFSNGNLERIIDDFVLMTVFVGNDFLPGLPGMHIEKNALGILFENYKILQQEHYQEQFHSNKEINGNVNKKNTCIDNHSHFNSNSNSHSFHLNDHGRVNFENCAILLEKCKMIELDNFESLISSVKDDNSNKNNNNHDSVSLDNKNDSISTIPNHPHILTNHQKNLFKLIKREFLLNSNCDRWYGSVKDHHFLNELANNFNLECIPLENEIMELCKPLNSPPFSLLTITSSTDQSETENEIENSKLNRNENSNENIYIPSKEILTFYDNLVNLKSKIIDDNENEIKESENDSFSSIWKNKYYESKSSTLYNSNNESIGMIKEYIRGIQWNMSYYYKGISSWNWYYPYHYPPLTSDLVNYIQMKRNSNSNEIRNNNQNEIINLNLKNNQNSNSNEIRNNNQNSNSNEMNFPFITEPFTLESPLTPLQQLLAVLPGESSWLLPLHLGKLMDSPSSPIKDFYPSEYKIDLDGKKNSWEAIILIPFIDEKKLLMAYNEKKHLLSMEELERNKIGHAILYKNQNIIEIEENDQNNRNQIENNGNNNEKNRNQKIDAIKARGGFPSLHTLPDYQGTLAKIGIQIFDRPSKELTILLRIPNRPLGCELAMLRERILGTIVGYNWPFLKKGTITRIDKITNQTELQDIYNQFYYKQAIELNNLSESIFVWILPMDKKNFNIKKNNSYNTINIKNNRNNNIKNTINTKINNTTNNNTINTKINNKNIDNQKDSILDSIDYFNSIPIPLDLIVFDRELFDRQDSNKHGIRGMTRFNNLAINDEIIYVDRENEYFGSYGRVIKSPYSHSINGNSQNNQNINGKDQTEKSLIIDIQIYPPTWYSNSSHRQQSINNLESTIKRQREKIVPYFNSRDIKIHSQFLGRITSSLHLFLGNQMLKGVNVGLDMKSESKNQRIIGLTRKRGGIWEYSTKALFYLQEYKRLFPEIYERIQSKIMEMKNSKTNPLLSNIQATDILGREFDNEFKIIQELLEFKRWKNEISIDWESISIDGDVVESQVLESLKLNEYLDYQSINEKKGIKMEMISMEMIESIPYKREMNEIESGNGNDEIGNNDLNRNEFEIGNRIVYGGMEYCFRYGIVIGHDNEWIKVIFKNENGKLETGNVRGRECIKI